MSDRPIDPFLKSGHRSADPPMLSETEMRDFVRGLRDVLLPSRRRDSVWARTLRTLCRAVARLH
jgi:hypothetical protein